MTEVPEHLRKKAAEARAKADAAKAGPASSTEETALTAEQQEAASKIPAHLLERSKAAGAKSGGEEAGGVVVATPGAGAPAATAGGPVLTGPGATPSVCSPLSSLVRSKTRSLLHRTRFIRGRTFLWPSSQQLSSSRRSS